MTLRNKDQQQKFQTEIFSKCEAFVDKIKNSKPNLKYDINLFLLK